LPRHTNLQRRRMWSLLTLVSDKATFAGYRLSKEEWKSIFTAHLYGNRDLPTRHFDVGQMIDFQLYIEAFCADNNINLEE
jgi:hypothetical protein